MAEFKLGRIRFVWKDEWVSGTSYLKDDVVRVNGRVYICVIGHTADPDFYVDADNVPARWNQASDGQTWRGDWTPDTTYFENDIVKYGAQIYICLVGHTSSNDVSVGLEVDLDLGDSTQTKWDQFAEGFDWKGDWTTTTRYKLNDIVKYGGNTYLCNIGHTSAPTAAMGLEGLDRLVSGQKADIDKWDQFSEAFDWKGDWTPSIRYKINDVVSFGGTSYVCNEGHTSAASFALGLEDDQSKWDYFNQGVEYLGLWDAEEQHYKVNDLVKNGNGIYICLQKHTSDLSRTFEQDEDSGYWGEFLEGIQFEDSWNSSTIYQPGDIITYGGYAYVATTNHSNIKPTESVTGSQNWDLFTTAFKFQQDWTDTTDYRVGDVVRLSGFTYVAIEDNTNETPPNLTYWEQLNPGIRWLGAWANGYGYVLGDAVRYGPNSYICVDAHTSATATNRPDVDISGTVWNLLANGQESSVLTTQGDIVYYGGAGPTRLPIGADGQVLVVNGAAAPEWRYWGEVDQLYYVSLDGIDSPAPDYGITLDKPWRTVRYAAEQIEKGTRNPQAARLMEINRQFVQRETVEWIDYQITNNISPFASAFSYDTTKCERDIGLIIDAILWDIRHGGNARSRKAAVEYVTNATTFYGLGQKEETVAAINYAIDTLVSTAVLLNTAPVTNYQVTNSVPVNDRILQIIDTDFVSEDSAFAETTSLKSLITTAIAGGVIGSVGAEVKPQRTILVKTGVFFETLPIVVPVDTAVCGDELRSTNIRPASSQISLDDVPKSLDALTRIKAIVSDIVEGVTVTKTTTGSNPNTQTQSQTKPFATATQGTLAEDLVQDAYDYIDFYVNSVGSAPSMTGSNAASASYDVYSAIRQLELNKEFIVAEVHAYISLTYPSYVYTLAACARDVNEYIDAIKYDLAYTGNYKTLTSARLYVNGVTGSITENMFLVRNSTGVRNLTVQGLTGTLVGPNIYGTFRPSAGAYTSLDPGWGPDDESVWITTRSCYVQNVTTFGTACIGCKIDGNLHNGGNKSIVSNDFTQVISDGIGVWCTNLGRTELVSVFGYYGHIGYLAENGGKIRATNGNSSYGQFGCVAEGVDVTEVPIIGVVNNRFEDALVTRTLTSGQQVYRVEYSNAGNNYTSGTFTFNGPGTSFVTVGDETRDGGIFELRLLDLDDSSGQFGGLDFLSSENVAQGGTATAITIAATDDQTSSAYVGMRIYIQSGVGVGQYGYITAYNAGSKVAQISRESTNTAGWDHVIPGTPITAPDPSSLYIIEPRVNIPAPTEATLSVTGGPSGGCIDAVFANVRQTFTNIAATGGSGTGATFNVIRNGLTYTVTLNQAGQDYENNDVLTIAGTSVGGESPTNDISVRVETVDYTAGIIVGEILTISHEGQGHGGNFVLLPAGSSTTAYYSTNGTSWSTSTLPGSSADWTAVAAGDISNVAYVVALGTTGTSTAAYSIDGGETWTASALPQTSAVTSVAFGGGRFVGVRSDSNNSLVSTGGTVWANGANILPGSTTWQSITYGKGRFFAVASGGDASAYSLDGISWTAAALPSTATWNSIAFGNNLFVALSTEGDIAISNNGTSWTAVAGTIDADEVGYGQGSFIATSHASSTAFYKSQDGITWTQGTATFTTTGRPVFGNPNRVPVWIIPSSTSAQSALSIGSRAYIRARVADTKIVELRIVEPGSGYSSVSPPTITITDPNNTYEAPFTVRVGNGVLANPTFIDRGADWEVATASVTGDGYADLFQNGSLVDVKGLYSIPIPGSNVEFTSLPGQFYKLVNVTQLLGAGPYTARLQVSPPIEIPEAVPHEDPFEIRIRYSQVRLTGHDFLDIGTGNFSNTNYPGLPLTDPIPANETVENNGGRVFYTSTDQDGNFRVGGLFTVEQSTGTATLNADAFNIAGLQELSLGSVELGTGGATITEFSTDPFFTQDSDTVIPTQRAIKAYISSQIGSGASTLNVNTLTAGQIFVANDFITTTTGGQINVLAKMNFIGGINGIPVAMNLFLHS